MPALVCAALLVALGSPPDPADVRRGVRELIDGDYQRELPLDRGLADLERGPAELGRADPRERDLPPAAPRRLRRERARHEDGVPMGLAVIAQALLWGLIAIGVGLAGFWLVRELAGYTGDEPAAARDAAPEERDRPERAVVERPLGDADELAGQGRFGEAVHTLLLRTLFELARRLPERLPASLTSREIVARVRMPDEARRALSVLVAAVEVSHFGGAEPGRADFLACREHFQRFAAAYMRGGA